MERSQNSMFFIKASIGTNFWAADNILADLKVMDTMGIMVAFVITTWCGWVAGNNFFFATQCCRWRKICSKYLQAFRRKRQKNDKTFERQHKRKNIIQKCIFQYNQTSKYALKNISLVIEARQKIAFLGESGSGKSTIILLQRFYSYHEERRRVKGLQTVGGEKQRVACARAILKNPKIFLSDEGTSALDRETQRRVQMNVDGKFKGATFLKITHRIDQIFMFESGQIIQHGTCKQMMERTCKQMMERKDDLYSFVIGNKFKTINQAVQQLLKRLVIKLLGKKKEE